MVECFYISTFVLRHFCLACRCRNVLLLLTVDSKVEWERIGASNVSYRSVGKEWAGDTIAVDLGPVPPEQNSTTLCFDTAVSQDGNINIVATATDGTCHKVTFQNWMTAFIDSDVANSTTLQMMDWKKTGLSGFVPFPGLRSLLIS